MGNQRIGSIHGGSPTSKRLDSGAGDTPNDALDTLGAIPDAALNPFGTAIKWMVGYAQKSNQEAEAARKILEEIRNMDAERKTPQGFAIKRINYRPADLVNSGGVLLIDTSDLNRKPVNFFSFISVPFGADDGTPNAKVIYGGFGNSLFAPIAGQPPVNFDFILSIGGKLQKYNVRQGLNVFSLWCKTPFDMILYVTPGSKDELPEL